MENILQNKGKVPIILLWLGPVFLFISMFSWIRPNPELAPAVNLTFRVMGIAGAVLLAPLIFYQFNINLWLTTTLGIWCAALAAYIYSGLVETTAAITFVIAAVQLVWLFITWRWSKIDAVEQQRRYVKRIMLEELAKDVSQWDIRLYKWSRLASGLLFVTMMTCACWIMLSIKYFSPSTSFMLTAMWAILLSLFLTSVCVALLISHTLHNLSNKLKNRKNATQTVLSSFMCGVVIVWIVPNLTFAVVFKYKAFWSLTIAATLVWFLVCLLWGLHVKQVVKKSEGVDFYQRIQESTRNVMKNGLVRH